MDVMDGSLSQPVDNSTQGFTSLLPAIENVTSTPRL